MREVRSIIERSQNKSDVISLIRNSSNYEFLNAGNDRIVAINTEISKVAKIEINNPRQNRREYRIYEDEKKLGDYILPILESDSDFKCIIYPVARYDVEKTRKKSFLEKMVKETGVFPRDFRMNEVGRFNNKIVLTDYGFGFESVSKENFDIDNKI